MTAGQKRETEALIPDPKREGRDLTEGGQHTFRHHAVFVTHSTDPVAQNPLNGEQNEDRHSMAESAYLAGELEQVP